MTAGEYALFWRGIDRIVREHPRYDPQTLRVLLTKEEIEALPVLAITREEDYEKRKSWFWNGWEHYPEDLKMLDGEVGYDDQARYIVK